MLQDIIINLHFVWQTWIKDHGTAVGGQHCFPVQFQTRNKVKACLLYTSPVGSPVASVGMIVYKIDSVEDDVIMAMPLVDVGGNHIPVSYTHLTGSSEAVSRKKETASYSCAASSMLVK